MEQPPDQKPTISPSESHRRFYENFWVKLVIGLVITFGMWWIAKWIEEKHFYFGTQARELVYDIVQHRLGAVARQNLNVTVVDVSDVGWTPVNSQPTQRIRLHGPEAAP